MDFGLKDGGLDSPEGQMLLSSRFKYHMGQDLSGNFKHFTRFKVEEKQKAKEKRKDIPI